MHRCAEFAAISIQVPKSSIQSGSLTSLGGNKWLKTTRPTIDSGTARNAPIGPHSQVQNAKRQKDHQRIEREPAADDGRRDEMPFDGGERDETERRQKRMAERRKGHKSDAEQDRPPSPPARHRARS